MLGQPPAPAGFTAAEKALWKATVTSRPASSWTPSDIVHLRHYIEALSDIDHLTAQIDREGSCLGDKVHPAVKVRAQRETFMLSLAMKLKLMPSNRYDAKTVARLGQHANKARAAMETIESDEDDLLGRMLQ